ncbi:hypothetical protein [Maricaulis sp.]|uniref:hypothetical protein n=1 Tax=Maricaulis sp. TaxID=1486257 RepID=UPI002637ABD5|nr:hypothetical protein [Maricaulis sp.]
MTLRFPICLAVLASVAAAPALAQDDEQPATPQTVAMEMFGLANQALESEDHETARRLLEAALDLKPGHPAVLRGLLTVALRAGHAGDAFHALERMADAGIAYDPSRAAELLRSADAARYEALADRLGVNGEAVGSAEVVARIDRSGALIEGVAVDIETDRLFLSSVSGREILMLEPFARDEPVVFADREDGLWSVFGLAVDDRSRLVWAGSAATDQTPLDEGESGGTALFAFDLVTGELYRRYEIDGAVQIADFVVRDGIVYASDSQAPRVYALNDISGELELLAADPRFVSLQGVALARGALYVADYATGLWRIDLGDGGVSLVRAGDESLIGIDGLRQTRDGRLLAVRNGTRPHQVMAIDLDDSGHAVAATEILLRGHPHMGGETGEPTLIDPADGRAWLVANAAWPFYSANEDDRPAGGPAPTVILEMDLE